jgi:type III secretion system FlhB-like substrate exporter
LIISISKILDVMENIPEEVFEAVKELLPQIEEDLRKEIYDQLILEY